MEQKAKQLIIKMLTPNICANLKHHKKGRVKAKFISNERTKRRERKKHVLTPYYKRRRHISL